VRKAVEENGDEQAKGEGRAMSEKLEKLVDRLESSTEWVSTPGGVAAEIRAALASLGTREGMTMSEMRVREAAQNLLDKLDRCSDDSAHIFTVAAIHGVMYDGANWVAEYEALKAALATPSVASPQEAMISIETLGHHPFCNGGRGPVTGCRWCNPSPGKGFWYTEVRHQPSETKPIPIAQSTANTFGSSYSGSGSATAAPVGEPERPSK
jgi:hypothetical protein